jgi:hypothetical protein
MPYLAPHLANISFARAIVHMAGAAARTLARDQNHEGAVRIMADAVDGSLIV